MKKHNRQRGRPTMQHYLDYDYERAFDTQASMLSESQIERALRKVYMLQSQSTQERSWKWKYTQSLQDGARYQSGEGSQQRRRCRTSMIRMPESM